ncbi:hypothetical protein ABBQ32_004247 [Trebouxia sp. C0010 RCD-2024]
MVTEKLGSNMAILLEACGGQFTVSTTMKIAVHLLDLVEVFHETCFVHRELKPDKIIIGNDSEADQLFLIDLELAAKYCSPQTQEHVPFSQHVSFVGNPTFASNRKVLGCRVSRRDELYSIALMLIHFMRGCLPWSNIRLKWGRSLVQAIKDVKLHCSTELLTKGLPIPVSRLMEHSLSLPFEARPDYDSMRQLFQQWSAHFGWDEELPYDWMRSSQPIHPDPVSPEQNVSDVSGPAGTDAVMQDLQSSADDAPTHSQPVGSTVQNASDQGTSADKGASGAQGESAHEGTVLYQGTFVTQGICTHEAHLPRNARLQSVHFNHLQVKAHPYATSTMRRQQSSQHRQRQAHTRQTQRRWAQLQQTPLRRLPQSQH